MKLEKVIKKLELKKISDVGLRSLVNDLNYLDRLAKYDYYRNEPGNDIWYFSRVYLESLSPKEVNKLKRDYNYVNKLDLYSKLKRLFINLKLIKEVKK